MVNTLSLRTTLEAHTEVAEDVEATQTTNSITILLLKAATATLEFTAISVTLDNPKATLEAAPEAEDTRGGRGGRGHARGRSRPPFIAIQTSQNCSIHLTVTAAAAPRVEPLH